MKNRTSLHLICVLALILISGLIIQAQTTKFTYQGNLNHNSQAANGNYDFEFVLFGVQTGGNQIGNSISVNDISVIDGIFTVELDFGTLFAGTNRFLEIRVRQTDGASSTTLGAGEFTTLSPRQLVTSSPYAIKSLSADSALTALDADRASDSARLGGTPAGQFIKEGDSRLTDARTPTPGNSNYIQNTRNQQTSSNFNISGNGTADKFDALTQYNLNGIRILAIPGTDNIFIGVDSGSSLTNGFGNTFVGFSAGNQNTGGLNNSFFGARSGSANLNGLQNSFFGQSTGESNTNGQNNSFFGTSAGKSNVTGNFNSFFGSFAGINNTSGGNSFFGGNAGRENTTGSQNSFFGVGAGDLNETGSSNTAIGYSAQTGSGEITNATAIGRRAMAETSNSLVLGSINGVNSATADTNVGIGTTSPTKRLHIAVNNGQILFGDAGCSSGVTAIGFGSTLSNCENYSIAGSGNNTFINTPPGGSIYFRVNNSTQARIYSDGRFRLNTLGSAGSTSVCRNSNNELATCSSSIRYKSNIENFDSGLELIRKLRPVSFNWTEGGMIDVGLIAEEVGQIEPLLTSTNKDGRIEGVKYDRIGVVLINAVKEQQAQIERQKVKGKRQNKQIESLQKRVDEQEDIINKQQADLETLKKQQTELKALKALICLQNPDAEICQTESLKEKKQDEKN